MKTIVIGGAYSVDKFYRLSKGYNWFEDEQPSDEIKAYVESNLVIMTGMLMWSYHILFRMIIDRWICFFQ